MGVQPVLHSVRDLPSYVWRARVPPIPRSDDRLRRAKGCRPVFCAFRAREKGAVSLLQRPHEREARGKLEPYPPDVGMWTGPVGREYSHALYRGK